MVEKNKAGSWLTTDEHEIFLRKDRALKEGMEIERLDDAPSVFCDYHVTRRDSDEPSPSYTVELRSTVERINSCNCPDFAKSALGTCKHIEKVIGKIIGKVDETESSVVEVFIRYTGGVGVPMVKLPTDVSQNAKLILKPYVDATGRFKGATAATLAVFLRRLEVLKPGKRCEFRVSQEIIAMNQQYELFRRNHLIQEEFEENFNNTTFLRHPLYDYQLDGMKHLAFKGRALLTDEMGLGKTVQAIAAAKILKQTHNIKRVLVVCPASLKIEWEEQIRKFTDLSSQLVYGSPRERHSLYIQTNAFFIVTNYEQIVRDHNEINQNLQPDLVILDEAQRIKNWRTKTAQTIKRLESRFSFVLTGTPLENRIDEVHSLTEFVDNRLLGSLFRFNREFYQFDENGNVQGLKNLRKLTAMLQPIMMRRRKDQIEDQLPERLDNNYFVTMAPDQRKQYEEFEYKVAVLSRIAEKRALRGDEFQRLQRNLSCMRMVCDSQYILDQSIPDSPKIVELESILNDLWENKPGRKVIIFSEWVKMLELVREKLSEMSVGWCWHVGSTSQKKRRDEINRFKSDPTATVFLSSDSGCLGLNLQAASVVINLDLPWHPAKLEQRIARAWRKHQKNTVNVINLIAEDSIEHRMLSSISFKKGLADAVLDGRGNIDDFEKPNARKMFMDRLSKILKTDFAKELSDDELEAAASVMPAADAFKDEISVAHSEDIAVCAIRRTKDSENVESVFAVSSEPEKTVKELGKTLGRTQSLRVKDNLTVLSLDQYKLLQDLAVKGIITLNDSAFEELIRKDVVIPEKQDTHALRAARAEELLRSVERPAQMASLLISGGFAREAVEPTRDVAQACLKALYVLAVDDAITIDEGEVTKAMAKAVKKTGWVDADIITSASEPIESADDVALAAICTQLLELTETVETRRLQVLM